MLGDFFPPFPQLLLQTGLLLLVHSVQLVQGYFSLHTRPYGVLDLGQDALVDALEGLPQSPVSQHFIHD